MKKNLSKTGVSLLELIIASMLIVIVVLGVFSINSVLRNNNQDYGQRYLVKSDTQNTLNHILNDASLAVGSGTNVGNLQVLDQGILIGASIVGGIGVDFCIHQQQQNFKDPINNPNGDIWVCYWLDTNQSDAAYRQIWYCNKTYLLNDRYRGAGFSCINQSQYLGTAYSINNPPPTFDPTIGSFSMTIQNCLDDTAQTCFNPDQTKQDPVNNPQVTLSGSVFPSQEGTQQN